MKKLFISQSMKNKTSAEILAVREEAIQGCRIENTCVVDYGITVIESYKH